MAGSQPKKDESEKKAAQRRSLFLLVADDERDTVETLSAILVDEGHSVVGLYKATEVLPQLRSRKPDAIVLDIDMPGLSGYTLAREIRQLFGDATPLLIAISGKWLGQSDRMLADLAGFNHFLRKPCDPTELLKLLDPLMKQRAAPDRPASDVPPVAMGKAHHFVRLVGDYLRAEIANRRTAEETKQFLNAIASEAEKTGCRKALICVHRSHAIFKVAEYDLAHFLALMSKWRSAQVALVTDSADVRASHEYVEVLAKQRGLTVRSFEDEARAVQWLRGLQGGSPSSTTRGAPDEHR